jgi:integrase
MIEVRLRYCGKRGRFAVADDARADAVRAMAKALTRTGIDAKRAGDMLTDAAKATAGELRALQALVTELAGGETEAQPESTSGPSETFATYAERWFDDRERRGLSSVDTDRGRIAKHVNPTLGPVEIRAVQSGELRALVERLDDAVRAGELHWNTARKIWGLVTKLFSDACRSKVAALRVREDNPARDVQGPDRGQPTAKQWLYPSEAAALLACVDVPVRWRRLYALATYLYLRPGELAALEWADVDLEHGIVHVHQALDLRTGAAKATKPASPARSRSTLPWPPSSTRYGRRMGPGAYSRATMRTARRPAGCLRWRTWPQRSVTTSGALACGARTFTRSAPQPSG